MNRQKKWEINDLLKRLNHVLDIAEKDIAVLLLEKQSETGVRDELALKQTSILLLAVHRASEYINDLQHRIAPIALQLIPYVRDEKLLAAPVSVDYLPGFVYSHVFLAKIGLPDIRFDDLVNRYLYTDILTNSKTALERIWLRKHWSGWEIDGPMIRNILAGTSLGEQLNFLQVAHSDINSFAVELFYAAAFSQTYWLLPEKKTAILEKTEIMLALCIDKEAYGLAASLLLGYRHLGKTWSAITVFAFNLLTTLVKDHGSAGLLNSETDILTAPDTFPSSSTMGLLYATCLKKGAAPYKKVPVSAIKKGTAWRLIPFHDSEITTSSWIKYFYLLEETEQDALSSFLFVTALIQNIHRQQYEKVSQLLNLGYVLGLANSPVALQAAEVLNSLESYF